MLNLVEETLDKVALAVECIIAIARQLSIRLGRDHRLDTALFERVDQGIGVESLIADQGARIGVFEQRFCAGQIVLLPWRQLQFDGVTQRIDESVDFGA